MTGAVVLALVVAVPPAGAKGGVVGGSGNELFLTNGWSTTAEINFHLGALEDVEVLFLDFLLQHVVGDWDGDGADTVGLRYGPRFLLRDALEAGAATSSFVYGRADDTPLAGDWDGDGATSVAVRRGRVLHVRDELTSGPATGRVAYGREGDTVLVGDWDGDGDDTLAVRRGATYHFTNALADGPAAFTQTYGRAADGVVVGDWDGDGVDTLGVRRANSFYLTNSFDAGPADFVVAFGRPSDGVLVGDWDGDGDDTLGVSRSEQAFGEGTHLVGQGVAPGTYRSGRSPFLGGCSWERRSSAEGGPGENVLGARSDRTASIVTVAPTDVAFASDCLWWSPVEATYPMSPLTAFQDGTYVVGPHVEPGTYTAAQAGGECDWARLAGFSGVPADVIEEGLDDFQPTVTIEATDAGFVTAACGLWEPAG